MKYIQDIDLNIGYFEKILLLLEKAIRLDPSKSIRDGDVIADGYNVQLDILRAIKKIQKSILIILKKNTND